MFYVVSTNQPRPLLHQAHAFIRSVRQIGSPPMTSEQIIERGLLFAKAEPSEAEMARAYRYYRFMILGGGERLGTLDDTLTDLPAILHKWWAETKTERRIFRSRLTEILQEPQKALSRRARYVKTIQNGVFMYADINDEGTEFLPRFHPLSNESAYQFVLFLLCTKERWKRLKRCDYFKCRSFFYRKASPTGGRPRDYCTAECQKQADQKKALIRQKEQRKRKAKKRGKKS